MKNINITHLYISGFGWENTILIQEDFDKIVDMGILHDKYHRFTGFKEGEDPRLLKGYYTEILF